MRLMLLYSTEKYFLSLVSVVVYILLADIGIGLGLA